MEPSTNKQDSLQRSIRALVGEAGTRMGCTTWVCVEGDLDALPTPLTDHTQAVIRAAVHNAVTHARASNLVVEVLLDHAHLTVEVSDDGDGTSAAQTPGHDLASVAASARELGGSFECEPGGPNGTVATWRVPVTSTPPSPRGRRDRKGARHGTKDPHDA